MRESEKELIWESISSVMAYIVYPRDLRSLVERKLNESQNIQEFIEKFKQAVSTERNPTHKTDGKIFLNDLRKRLG